MIPNTGTPVVVNLSQGDIGRELTFKLVEGSDPNITIATDATAITIEGTKPSGLGFTETCTATSDNTITVSTTEAMTQESGMIPAEIRFTQGTTDIGTANFILAVEKTPHADGTTDGTQETMANLETRLQGQIDDLDARVDAIEGDQSIIDDIDALDARVTALEQGGSGLTQQEKNLILQLFSKAAYAEDDAGTAYTALSNLWSGYSITWSGTGYTKSNSAVAVSAGASFTSTVTANTGFNITAVTVTMGGNTVQGAWSNGTVTIPNVTGDIVITVTTAQITVSSISAVYTQSGTVYDTDSLDSLKSGLVVTATFMDSSTGVIDAADYTLSGTLTEGTSTITVAYGGKTATFSVTVTHMEVGLLHYWNFLTGSLADTVDGETIVTVGANTTTTSGTGLVIDEASDYVAVPFALADGAVRAKIKFGAFSRTAFGNERLICISSSVTSTPNVILRYDNTNSIWETQNNDSTGITDPEAFENAEIILERNNNSASNFNVIFENNTIVSNYTRGSASNAISVGSKDGSSFYSIVVESIKVYSE